jgi:hypothetical protein
MADYFKDHQALSNHDALSDNENKGIKSQLLLPTVK